jgi:hypothetical protein
MFSRKVLHFTRQGVFRECYVSQEHSCYSEIPFTVFDVEGRYLNCIRAPHQTYKLPPSYWQNFIEAYSKTEFSNIDDRLIALSSLAKAIQPIFGSDQYYAGLWRSTIIDGILWYTVTPSASLTMGVSRIAPSWSWASAMDPIIYSIHFDPKYLVQVLGISVLPAQLGNLYGNLERGELKLRGLLVEKWLSTDLIFHDRTNLKPFLKWDRFRNIEEVARLYTILPCIVCRYPEVTSESGFPHETGTVCYLHLSLVLEPVSQESHEPNVRVYRRIGYLEYYVPISEEEWAAEVPFDEYETIILI